MQKNEPLLAKKFSMGGRSAHVILLMCTLLYTLNYMDRQVLSAVQEVMKGELALSDTRIGFIQTVFLMSIALFSLPAAFLADRWSRRKALGVMAIVWSIFTYLTGLGKSFTGILVPRAFVGIGEAGYGAVGTAMVTAAYPGESRGKVMGIFNLAVPVGSAVGVILGGYLSVHHGGWRTPFAVFAVPGILLGILAFFLRDYKTVVETDELGKKKNFLKSAADLFKIPTLRWFYLGYPMMQVMVFSFFVWAPAFFIRAHGVREDRAGMLMGVIGMMAIIGAVAGGIIADWWQKRNPRGRMLLASLATGAGTLLLLSAYLLDFKGVGYVLGILFGIVTVMNAAPLGAVTQDVVKPGSKSIAWGMNVLLQYVLGGGWGPLLVGALSDHLGGGAHGLKVALMLAATGGIIASVFYLIASRHYPSDMEKVRGLTLEAEK